MQRLLPETVMKELHSQARGRESKEKVITVITYGCFFKNRGKLQNGWLNMENPIKMDDLGGTPLFLETPI